MRICLIIPPSIFLLDERVFVSLGILKVAAVLEKHRYKVDVLDLSGIKNYVDPVLDYLSANDDVMFFGITSTTPQLPATIKIVAEIKRRRDWARVILGGPHITLVNSALKRESRLGISGRATKAMETLKERFDVLIAGDGEFSIFEALKDRPSKVIDADTVEISGDGHRLFLNEGELNAQPFPARHLIDLSSYKYSIDGVGATSLIAQLGCPFACGFCGGRESNMLRRIRTRTTENIIEEMLHIHKTYGINGFMMYDDELNVNKQVIDLMRSIRDIQRKMGLEWRLRGFLKSQLVTEEQARAMYEAGFRWVLVGFESGSPSILEAMNKKATREENTRCMKILQDCGLKVKALMSIGHPGESHETIEETREWLLEVHPEDFDVSIITCYPGTPYYDQAVQDTSRGDDIWVYKYPKTGEKLYQIGVDYTETTSYYKGDPDGGYVAYVFTDHLSSQDLVRERDNLERDVRKKLGIPFNQGRKSDLYEHSMGQTMIPSHILRSSN